MTTGMTGVQIPTRLSFKCPRCGFVSYHPKDVELSYCGNCHKFMDRPITEDKLIEIATRNRWLKPYLI